MMADFLWYERLENIADDATLFSVARSEPPPGWVRGHFDAWVAWQPQGARLPAQGWKVHVSAVIDEADTVIGIVRDYCLAAGVAFKFLRSRQVYLVRNEKYASRASSGKICVLYPVDEVQLERTLRELSASLAGRRGPYILSDLRWGDGPLYIRYGAFNRRYCINQEDGEFVPAMSDDHGCLVPDHRAPWFSVPPWAHVPDFIADRLLTANAGTAGTFPYEVREALHFSNSGGIYLAADPVTDQPLVLREARPFAGLDTHETDAVSRLHRERAVLLQLSGLDVVPGYLGSFTFWEHHYLAEEYIEGELLQHAIAGRHPYLYGPPTDAELTAYTDWALATISEVERAIAEVHQRGIVFGDLHPFNIIVRPDGRAALIDFEESSATSEERRPGLGAPGYVPPWPLRGIAVDEYALNCVRLALFISCGPLLSLAPWKARRFAAAVADRFPVPAAFRDQLLHGFAAPAEWDQTVWHSRRPGLHRPADDKAEERDGGAAESWLSSMGSAIAASATPDRADRLFPGDARGFAEGGVSIAHGAAGVLYALAASGAPVPPEYVRWLARAARRCEPARPGLYGGLDGVAVVLALLGRHDDAMEIAGRASGMHKLIRRIGVYDGLAGVGLARLQLAAATGSAPCTQDAMRIADELTRMVKDPDVVPAQAGLMDGWAGVAAFFVRLYEATGQTEYLCLAETAIRRDLDRCVPTKNGGLQVKDGPRVLLYLATGSSGIGLAIQLLLGYRPDTELAAAVTRIRVDLDAEFVMLPGLFQGRAGLLLASAALGGPESGRLVTGHLRRFDLHEVRYRGHSAFPGGSLLRLSMDLATGTAGILLAATAALSQRWEVLPGLGREGQPNPEVRPGNRREVSR